jgi:hypothetical protein
MKDTLLYHDGGIEVQNGKLPGLVSQADVVVCCSVACVSHPGTETRRAKRKWEPRICLIGATL